MRGEMAMSLPLGQVGVQPVSKFVMLSYTEGFAMEVLNRRVHPYWQRADKAVNTMLTEAQRDYQQLDARYRRDQDRRAGLHHQHRAADSAAGFQSSHVHEYNNPDSRLAAVATVYVRQPERSVMVAPNRADREN